MDIPNELIKAERLIAAGQLEEAKAVLRGILAQDKRNAAAWYLVAQSVTDPRAKAESLRRTLLTDPDHPRAKREFEAMDGLSILQPPSMTKPTPATPAVPPRKTPADVAPQRRLPLVPLLISGGVMLVVLVGLALMVLRPSNSPTPTALALAASASPNAPPTATALPSTPTPIANVLPTAGDALAQTATAIQQNIAATGTGLAQAAGNKTQIAALTQTATQQGALGATVAAQQTAMAASNALPGTLILVGSKIDGLVTDKISYVPSGDYATLAVAPDGKHIAYGKSGQNGWYIANLDGSEQKPITGFSGGGVPKFGWSPNGQWLLALLEATPNMLYLVSPKDGIAKLIVTHTTLNTPVWSANSQQFALVGTDATNSTLEVVEPSTAMATAIPLHFTLLGKNAAITPSHVRVAYSVPGWLGNASHLFLMQVVSNPQNYTDAESQINIYDFNLTDQTQHILRTYAAKELQQISTVSVAPNGQYLAFDGYTDEQSKLFLLSADGHDVSATVKPSVGVFQMQWSPDSHSLALVIHDAGDGNTKIQWVTLADGSVHDLLPNVTSLSAPLWSPDSRSLLVCHVIQRDGTKILSGETVLVPIAAGSTPVTLFDKLVCPYMWLP